MHQTCRACRAYQRSKLAGSVGAPKEATSTLAETTDIQKQSVENEFVSEDQIQNPDVQPNSVENEFFLKNQIAHFEVSKDVIYENTYVVWRPFNFVSTTQPLVNFKKEVFQNVLKIFH